MQKHTAWIRAGVQLLSEPPSTLCMWGACLQVQSSAELSPSWGSSPGQPTPTYGDELSPISTSCWEGSRTKQGSFPKSRGVRKCSPPSTHKPVPSVKLWVLLGRRSKGTN